MRFYLGVDSGGTKTKFLLVNELGEFIFECTQSASHYLQVGLDGLKKVLDAGLNECLLNTNLNKNDLKHVFVSVAGYGDIEDDNRKIEEIVHAVFNPISVTVGNDVENAYAGALGDQPGIVIIAGTGSIGLGIDSTGTSYRSGGWHHAFGGDEGSAFWIGEKLILEYTCQSDGRSKRTRLHDYMNEKYNFKSDSDILRLTIIDWDFDRTRIAGLARDVASLAMENDPAAIAIFKASAYELSRIIISIKTKLSFKGLTKASYSGGVFKSGDLIIDPLSRLLKPYNVELVPPILSPDAGGVLLALKHGGVKIDKSLLKNLSRRKTSD